MQETNTTINLEISKELKKQLRVEAKSREMSVSGLVRFILKEYFNGNQS